MSKTSVAETVWPWRTAVAGSAPQPEKSHRLRAVIEATVMTTAGLVLHFKFGKVWIPGVVWTLAALTLLGGLCIPALYRRIHNGALWLGKTTALGVTWLLLVPFFYLCFPLARLILILNRKDPLHRTLEPGRTSYWTAHENVASLERYRRQF
ncbi:MAG: hypothetical protein O3B24_11305 [Verrucomicrobia bacterium]|nr:hypothetical protein [Verrucomicrobiota bacterium]